MSSIATNYFLLSGAEFFSKILAAAAFAYLAHEFGPVRYGHLEFALAITLFFTLVVDSGLSSYGAREIAKDEDSSAQLIIHITLLRFILALIAFIILTIILNFFIIDHEVKQLILIYSATLFGVPLLIQWIFQGRDLMQYVAIASILRWVAFAIGVFSFVKIYSQLWVVPLVEGIAIIICAIFLISSQVRFFGFPKVQIDIASAVSIIKKAFPIGASELVWAVKVYFATVVLGFIIGGPELGWFSAAHRIVISLHAFVWLYFYNLLPSISRGSQGSISALHHIMRISMPITAWAAIFLGIFGTAYANSAITLLFGSQFAEAARAFQVLIWLIPLALMSGHYRYALIGYDKQLLEFASAAIGAIVNIALNIFLIPKFSYIGSAWALIISEAAILLVSYQFVRRTIVHVPIWTHLRWPLVAGVVLTGVFYLLLPVNIWLAGSSAFFVFILILIIGQPNLIRGLRAKYARDQAL